MALKKADITEFKKQLEEMRNQLNHVLEGSSKEVKTPDEATGYSQHQADQGTDDFDRTISQEVISSEFGLLRQIERALEKIDEGTYGKCDVTGKDIPIKRLQAIPYANMTVEAQEQIEKGLI
ncbi:MAG: TraR/DksA family transcriptional regulator [Chlamydiia bacterium]|nr:TraR/DksA family transcriptional regulator [Chlamydiia bacterium]